jgi:chromosome segregation ATPase
MTSLAASQVQSAKRFAQDLSESQLQILNSDIDAANKQLSILTSECESLSQRLKDLEFNFDELTVEQKELAAQEPEPADDPTQFFAYLSSLETRESENKARLDAHRKLQGDLQHQLNRLRREHRSLEADFARLSEQADAEAEVLQGTRACLPNSTIS